ncbi:MarR family EPS-associated transcriptional regulator [Marinimicrobium sp. C2-29]|uniref:MarR family EPS-associated transcriptional regulator n=1 Tax=Marinimicrobium sp. C2-29 TaxID=3139825 RepID=UPI003138D403
MVNDEYRYKVLKILEDQPEITQRQLAKSLGISLGKVNYCLKALAEKGMIKAANFRNSQNKKAYTYLLTPRGIEEKARMTVDFLRIKLAEHDALTREIAELKKDVSNLQEK